jgi:hypothetical protein
MKQFLLLSTLAIFVACNSKKKDEPATPGTDTTVTTTKTDTIPPVTTGKIDIETFGPLKLGQPVAEMLKALGEPSSKTQAIEWAADGLMHSDWEWTGKGLVLGMSYEKGKEAAATVFSIIARSPCDFKTRAGMGLGSTYADVQAAYSKDIDPEATDKTQITVGSVYGGIIFSFTNDKASKIFLGAEAE